MAAEVPADRDALAEEAGELRGLRAAGDGEDTAQAISRWLCARAIPAQRCGTACRFSITAGQGIEPQRLTDRLLNKETGGETRPPAALEVIGGKWKGLIIYHLLSGTLRFGELNKRLGDVTQRTLTRQLRELETDGLVKREVYAVVPPKVEYSLTKSGSKLEPIIQGLRQWGVENVMGAS